jgi:SAM-dependent methyltransferase
MSAIALYRDEGLVAYEKTHYANGEQRAEIEAILSWYGKLKSKVLDLGCSGGLHALELAKRGHRVTGVDMEPSAVALAVKRCERSGIKAEFRVLDLEREFPRGMGRFDLIYSLGNVIAHIAKKRLPSLLAEIGSSLGKRGIFLFDCLNIGDPFPEEIREEELGITWQRRLDRESGEILLRGIFERVGVTQEFRVWGYTMGEMTELLREAGFARMEVSPRLDFALSADEVRDTACLRYRARL